MRSFPSLAAFVGSPCLAALVVAGSVLGGSSEAVAQGGSGDRCAAPKPGRYLAVVKGTAGQEPVALLLQETWNADGSVNGVRMERRGGTYRERSFTGRLRAISNCRVAIERSYEDSTIPSQVFLDGSGRPSYGIALLPGVVVSGTWTSQPTTSCSAAVLDGELAGVREGLDRRGDRWLPSTIVQRERWQGGRTSGVGVASAGSSLGESTYSGTLTSDSTCLATIEKTDSLGNRYRYRGIVLSDGSGYAYLQTDPERLSVGMLRRLP